ncbi:hypothetical protein KKG63_01180, partial [Patescibacteria group bacterium]|nr:hypothetical protein [Patescibacteria group bacterium]
PFEAIYCLMSGHEWAKQGLRERYCKETFTDGGQLCSTGNDCKSKKCVIGVWDKKSGVDLQTLRVVSEEEITLGIFDNLVNSSIGGRCSPTNQSPCYSGELLIDESRRVINPGVCD